MKFFKIVFFGVMALVVLLIAGLYIFFKTFDLNQHVPQITRQISLTLGRDFKVGGAQMGFSFVHGIGLQIRGITLADDPRFSDKPFLTLDHIEAGLNVNAFLFERRIQVTDVVMAAPRIVIIRSGSGTINAAGIGAQPSPAATVQASSSAGEKALPAALLSLLVKDVKITDADITYIDRMVSPELVLRVSHIDAQLKDLSFVRPFHVTLKAAVFAVEQNMTVDADLALDMARQAVRLTGLKVTADLAKIDLALLKQDVPMIGPAGLKKIDGTITLSVADALAGAAGLTALKAQILFEKGDVLSTLLGVPAGNIMLKADMDEKKIDVGSVACTIADGTLKGTASITGYLADPAVATVFKLDTVDVKKLLGGYKLPVKISGNLSASGSATFQGKTPESILASLKGDAQGELKNGQLDNVNLLALGLEKIPMLPGLLDSVLPGLSADTQEDVRQGITRFDTCRAQATMAAGVIQVAAADLATRDLIVHGQGTLNMSGPLDFKGEIRMAKAVSDVLVAKAGDLSALRDEQSRIYMPLSVSGTLLKPRFIPDVDYLTRKIIASQGSEQLKQVLGTPEASQAVNAVLDLFKKK